jgi:ribosomal protein S19E (S16A)
MPSALFKSRRTLFLLRQMVFQLGWMPPTRQARSVSPSGRFYLDHFRAVISKNLGQDIAGNEA